MSINQNHYNIMTSCNEALVPYLTINIFSISENLKSDKIDFYLFYSNISDKSLKMLDDLCKNFQNIILHTIKIPHIYTYICDEIAKYGGGWCGEAYYSLLAHLLLPQNVERILYIDAGDVIVVDDIFEYYNCNFENNHLMVTCSRFKIKNNSLVIFDKDDLQEIDKLPEIARGLFNSGSYMINLERMREDNVAIEDFQNLLQGLIKINQETHIQEPNKLYWGDQGFLSLAFVGNIKYYAYPKIRNLWHMPYNFCIWYYDRMNVSPNYKPAVIHFAGIKPWNLKYPILIERYNKNQNLHLMNELEIGKAEHYYLWHEYAIITDNILKQIGY